MKKAAFIIIVFTVLSKITGFGRDITLSYFYGASNISDAYLIAFTIPGVIFSFLGTGIATSYIPIYSEIEKNKSTKIADLFTSNMINTLTILLAVIIIIGLIFSYPIVKMLAFGFDNETLNLAVFFTRISMFGIFISVIIHVFASYLNIKNNFHIPAMMGIPFNIFIVLSIFASAKLNIVFLPVGIIIALLSQLLLLMPYMKKEGYKFKVTIDLKDDNLRKLFYLSIPVVLGVSVNQINVLVDRTIASTITVGGISALNYANRLNLLIQGLFVVSIATAMYPMISKMASQGNMKGLKKSLGEAINIINLLVVPATLGAMVFAQPIIKLLFGRGAFDSQALTLTSSALFYYSIGMIGFGLREILSRAFYSLQNTKTPMINAAISMVLNIILNILLSRYMGISGLALATSISAIFFTVILFISLRKRLGPFGMKSIITTFIKVLFSGIIMVVLAKTAYGLLLHYIGESLSLILSIGIGALVYMLVIYFMRIEDVDAVISKVKTKLYKNSTN